MRIPPSFFAALSAAFTFTMCSRPPAADAPPLAAAPPLDSTGAVVSGASMIPVGFACPDSSTIYAIFRTDSAGKSEVSLAIGDERLTLPQAQSASGARYADSTTVFWNKGKEGTLERGGTRKVCTAP